MYSGKRYCPYGDALFRKLAGDMVVCYNDENVLTVAAIRTTTR
jgi:hypothetical protein